MTTWYYRVKPRRARPQRSRQRQEAVVAVQKSAQTGVRRYGEQQLFEQLLEQQYRVIRRREFV